MTDWGLLCKRIDSSWVETAKAVQSGDAGKSRRDCAQTARELVQLAAFTQLCRRKQLLPDADVSHDLTQSISPRAWQSLLSRLADIDGPPEILARIHQRLLGIRPADDGQGTAGHAWHAVSENKTKKAGGVFYTPDYVTRYMPRSGSSRHK